MKEEINLLPPGAKVLRQRLLYGIRWGRLLHRALVLLAILAITLGVIDYRMRNLAQTLQQERQHQEATNSQSAAETARELNRFLSQFHARVQTHPSTLPLVADILRAMPSDIFLTGLAKRSDEAGLYLQGVSTSRSAVLEFQEALEKLPWSGRIEAPLSNFATGEQRGFSFTVYGADKEADGTSS